MATATLDITRDKPAKTTNMSVERSRFCSWLKGEIRVLLTVLSAFLLFELAFRFGGQYLSKDIAHLRQFSVISAQLASTPADHLQVLFLGNSLTRYGVSTEKFGEICQQENVPVVTAKVTPDNTALADWFYAYRTYFDRPDQTPQVLIIGFEGGHLRDAPSRHPDRLAQYYCTSDDAEELSRYDIQGLEEQLNFQLCRFSAAYGNRDRIQRRVLDLVIPDYRAGMDRLNARMNRHQESKQENAHEYRRLLELIAIAERKNVQVILAAMPVPEVYEFDPELLEVVESTSAELIDCRVITGIEPEMFFDGLHMDEQAQCLYTTELAKKCLPILLKVPSVN